MSAIAYIRTSPLWNVNSRYSGINQIEDFPEDNASSMEQTLAISPPLNEVSPEIIDLSKILAFQPRRYALIINGNGGDAVQTPTSYEQSLEDVRSSVQRLRAEGFDGIYVISPDFNQEGIYTFEPSEQSVEVAVTQIKTRLRPDDSLIIYTTGHGSIEPNGEARIFLPDGYLTESDFIRILGDLSPYNISAIMAQCYAGGWADTFSGENMFFVASSRANETTIGNEFSQALWGPVADLSSDGVVSLAERTLAGASAERESGITVFMGESYVDRGLGTVAARPPFSVGLQRLNSTESLEEIVQNYRSAASVKERDVAMLALRRIDPLEIPQALEFIFGEVLSGESSAVESALTGLAILDFLNCDSYVISRLVEEMIINEQGDGTVDPDIMRALTAVGKFFPDAVMPRIVGLLDMADPELQIKALQILGNMREKAEGALPSIYQFLQSPYLRVKREAISAIGLIGMDTTAIIRLLDMVQDDLEIRIDAVEALRVISARIYISHPELLPEIGAGLCDVLSQISLDIMTANENESALAISIMGALRSLKVYSFALPLPTVYLIAESFLSSFNPDERKAALNILTAMGEVPISVFSKMLILINDPNENIRRLAQMWLTTWAFNNREHVLSFLPENSFGPNPVVGAYIEIIHRLLQNYETLWNAIDAGDKEAEALSRGY